MVFEATVVGIRRLRSTRKLSALEIDVEKCGRRTTLCTPTGMESYKLREALKNGDRIQFYLPLSKKQQDEISLELYPLTCDIFGKRETPNTIEVLKTGEKYIFDPTPQSQ